MEALDLSRLQFAVTTIYHFFFVPLTLGLSLLVAIMQTMWYRTDNPVYQQMAKFWGKLFVINFAMGVVTGIVQEFQFGMNWSEYSRFMGDIFGAPLAIEALLAFYLESTFIGVWLFGWDKLSKGLHLAAIWLVAIGANISALWILIANSFMQQPVGYKSVIDANGVLTKVELDNFGDVITNPNVLVQWPHVFAAGLTTAAFFVLGISAWHLLRKSPHGDFFLRSARIATVYGVIGLVLVVLVGHSQAQHMVETQPMKMAAAEGLFESEDPASFSLLTIGDLDQREEVFAIRIPKILSLLSYNKLEGEVKGINDLQAQYETEYGADKDYRPPIALIYWSFRAMVGAGFLMLALAAFGLYLSLRERFTAVPRYLQVLPFAIVLPYVANSAGWIMTEMGRQPWIVFGLQRTEDAVSPNVSTGHGRAVAAGLHRRVWRADGRGYLPAGEIRQGRPRSGRHRAGTRGDLKGGEHIMELYDLWFVLISVLFIGFFFLEGFDYGVGILLPFLGKNDDERRQIINTIGPVWDANEVWMITAGGALFAAFPQWYATLFSGFYLALVVILLALIVRGVAFEFRSKDDNPQWRRLLGLGDLRRERGPGRVVGRGLRQSGERHADQCQYGLHRQFLRPAQPLHPDLRAGRVRGVHAARRDLPQPADGRCRPGARRSSYAAALGSGRRDRGAAGRGELRLYRHLRQDRRESGRDADHVGGGAAGRRLLPARKAVRLGLCPDGSDDRALGGDLLLVHVSGRDGIQHG